MKLSDLLRNDLLFESRIDTPILLLYTHHFSFFYTCPPSLEVAKDENREDENK